MSWLDLSASFEYLCDGSTVNIIFLIISVRAPTSESTSESYVYKRPIVTSKVGPRTERVNRKIN